MGRADGIYKQLPVAGQHIAVSAYGAYWKWLRFGPGFQSALSGFRERDRFNEKQWDVWCRQRLIKVLASALRTPYYRGNWSSAQVRAAEMGHLGELPILEKGPLRMSPEAFVDRSRTGAHPSVFLTSGSTGTPIATYMEPSEIRASMAVREARSAGWAGVSFNSARATFSGRPVVPDPKSKGPFYRFNVAERQAYLSAFHLSPHTARHYVEALRACRTTWLTGYAGSFYLLATYILDQNLSSPDLNAVITTSEKLNPKMRTIMADAFQCKIFEEYSTVENAVFASECSEGRLHVSPDVGLVEILRPDGSPCDPGESGEVVATSLLRTYQPLIRFRLGDIAEWDPEPCPCGRELPVLREVLGRTEDVVTGPDGRQMVRFHGLYVGLPNIVEGQVVQESVNELTVNVVVTPEFSDADARVIIERVQQRLGPEVHVSVKRVDSIPRSPSGKFRAVVSKLEQTDQ